MSDLARLLQDFAEALDAPVAPPPAPRVKTADLLAALGQGVAAGPVAPPMAALRTLPRIIPKAARPKGPPPRVPQRNPVENEDQPRQNIRAMVEEQVAADPARLPWEPEWWRSDELPMQHKRCLLMWQTALRDLLADALRDVLGLKPLPNLTTSAGTRAWLGSRDFHMVCALAGLDGGAVEDRVMAAIATDAGAAALYRTLCQHGEAADARIEDLRRAKNHRRQRNAA